MRKTNNVKAGIILLIFLSISISQCAIADNTVVVTLAFYGPNQDINHDGYINYLDASSLVSHYGNIVPRRPRYDGDYRYDINGDGVVNYLDVSSLVSHYGERWTA